MGNVQMVGKSRHRCTAARSPSRRSWRRPSRSSDVAERAVDFWLSVEDLPDPDNRVTLADDGNVVLRYTPNNREPMEQLYHRVKKHLSHLGHAPAPPDPALTST